MRLTFHSYFGYGFYQVLREALSGFPRLAHPGTGPLGSYNRPLITTKYQKLPNLSLERAVLLVRRVGPYRAVHVLTE